jgi:Na+/proline symporter/signal transduction histidine kinase
MNHELLVLLAAGIIYLVVLFLVAYATESGLIPERWVGHPITYTLSLGVYATSWSYYGSVGFAASSGYQFLTIYLGVTIAFLLSPVLLSPILRLTRDYQLTSLADLFAFRYRSQTAGIVVTIFMLVGALPYIALQIRAVTESLRVLTDEAPPHILAMGFCVTLTLFAILFGARHITAREKHRGLVVAIAFESLVKLIALLFIGGFALMGIFSGPGSVMQWLAEHPQAIEALYEPVKEGPWYSLLFLAFAAAFLLPRQFHMAFTENLDPSTIRTASWAFPLYLLLLNLPIPIVLWAGQSLQLNVNPDYYVLAITLSEAPPWLSLLAFIGGVSAASAMVIVSTLALSSMCLNHLLMPASYPDPKLDLYRWLLWGRRMLIAFIIMAGYFFYALLEHKQSLVQLGLISFVAVAQFMPGVLGLLYWRRATRSGFIAGLAAGIIIWSITLLIPLLQTSGIVETDYGVLGLQSTFNMDRWSFATFWSLLMNGALFVGISLITRQSHDERSAALLCSADTIVPLFGVVAARSPKEFREGLSEIMGDEAAEKEVHQALQDLNMSADEARPAQLRQLRERIERNLSGLMGPQLAYMIVNQQLELDAQAKMALADSMRFVEDRLEQSRLRLDGLSAELDNLRRYHRRILMDLPVGVCAISPDQEVTIWNLAMELSSGVLAKDVLGKSLSILPAPWNDLLSGFAKASDNHIYRIDVQFNNRPHWYNLHKALFADPYPSVNTQSGASGLVILLEDLTDLENLEAELAHSDRLASIGRLAAGVAHEIGNPVTGIASLAQNLRDETDINVVGESIESILDQTKRITDIVRSLMNFSRSDEAFKNNNAPVALNELLTDAINLVHLTHKQKPIHYDGIHSDNLQLKGDRQRLAQIFVNLLNNACDASENGKAVKVNAFEKQGRAVIEFKDQGRGISPEVRDTLFEPFVTTKPVGQGTGLGLALVHQFIEEHNGTVNIESQQGLGTRVVVTLPMA